MRFFQLIVAAWLMLLCVLTPVHAEKRVALIVGNGAYTHADRLDNPVNDARGMREALTALKFDVVYGEDLDLKKLRRAIGRFNESVDDADVALVYFAGHGATFGGVPYVVPVDAEFMSLPEMPAELVAVEELIGDLRRAKSLRIAILDACRDNAAEQALKKSRGGPPSRGLAPTNPTGMIITYATQPGATAADLGTGRNSPFTAALLHNIAAPGIDVKDMFFKVGNEVIAATGGLQRPEISISMYEPYTLVPAAAASAGDATVTPPPGGGLVAEAAQVWEAVKNATDIAVVDGFLRRYGTVPVYGDLARAKRAELQRLAMLVPPPSLQPDAPLTTAQERALERGDTFRECAGCPAMVVVPAGSFRMGKPASEADRDGCSVFVNDPPQCLDEEPRHLVTIRRPFAVGKLHVTRDEFTVFANETRFSGHSGCDWRNPGFAQDGSHPVVCIHWDDAKAYVDWLAKKTGRPYRLLSEAEFEYAARGGTTTPFWWGSSITPDQANYDGNDVYEGGGSKGVYREGTVPDGSFAANPWGLYNVHGNAYQWTADCYHDSYKRAPSDGSAWTSGDCSGGHVVRGGSWHDQPRFLRAAFRFGSHFGADSIGFRIARRLISAESLEGSSGLLQ